MSYETGEAAILAVLRADANFSPANTSRGDWKILNSGKSLHYVILRPGEAAVSWMTPNTYMAIYVTVAEVWQKYTDDKTSHINLYAAVSNTMNALMPERRLNSSAITDATIRSMATPTEQWNDSGGPVWLKQEVSIEWKEESQVTFTD